MDNNFDLFYIFYRYASENPEEVMIYTTEGNVTYGDALKKVEYYANEITSATGGKSTRILLYLDHGYNIITSILAVIKTGNSYVPVRKEKNFTNLYDISLYCNSNLVITDSVLPEDFRQIHLLDSPPYFSDGVSSAHYRYRPEDEIYVLFTSGSTGRPKGCSITYQNLRYILSNMIEIGAVEKGDVYCFSTPYTFDVSTTEIYSFVYGAKILVFDPSQYECFKVFPKVMAKYGVTHCALSPSSLKNLIDAYDEEQLELFISPLKCVMVAGEAFKKSIFDIWDSRKWKFRLLNLYGPTEATVYATQYEFSHGDLFTDGIPIGTCLQGCSAYIDQPNELGIGEIVLCGDGISAGYINDGIANTEKFIKTNENRCYRTGDLVSQKNGLYYYHGRNDDQVQINGIRVELGEIEHRILAVKEIREAVVLHNDNLLIAFIHLKPDCEKNFYEIEEYIKNTLPRYMHPNIIRFVDKMPLNASNKIDRKRLLSGYLSEKKQSSQKKVQKSTEATVLRLMKECLMDEIDFYDEGLNFFENGADSLDAFRLLTKLEKEYNISLGIDILYLYKTPARISQHIDDQISCNRNIKKEKNTSSEILDLYSKIPLLSEQIKHYLYRTEITLINKYEAIHTQKGYYRSFFEGAVYFHYALPSHYDNSDIKTALVRLLKNEPILYSRLCSENSSLFFEQYDVDESLPLPSVSVEQVTPEFLEFLLMNYLKEVYYARYHNGFLALFIIVKDKHSSYIVGILDHTIADASTVSILKSKLGSVLMNEQLSQGLSYEDYCSCVHKNNSDIAKVLSSPYFQKILMAEYPDRVKFVESLCSEHSYFVRDLQEVGSVNKSIFLSYMMGKMVGSLLPRKHVGIRTLFNLREYDGYSFKETLGDMHVGITFVYEKGMSFDAFFQEAMDSLKVFSEKMFRPSYIIENEKLRTQEERTKLELILDNANLLHINYLGEFDDDELKKLKESIPVLQDSLYSITKAIYVTAVSNHGRFHIFVNKTLEDAKESDSNSTGK